MSVGRVLVLGTLLIAPAALGAQGPAQGPTQPPPAAQGAAQGTLAAQRFFRGNTHTHTWNSDGDSPPDAVLLWYRDRGYHFVVITDHEWVTDVAPLNALYATP